MVGDKKSAAKAALPLVSRKALPRPILRRMRTFGVCLVALLTFGCGDSGSGSEPASSGSGGADTGSGGAATGGAASGGTSTGGGAASGGASTGGVWGGAGSPAAVTVQVDYDAELQEIDGFGTATSWGAIPPDAQLDAFFSVTKGAGLSILRNRIPFREAPANNDNFLGGGNYTYSVQNQGTANEYKQFTLNWGNWDLAAHKALIGKLKKNADYAVASYFSTPWTPPNNSTSKWKLGVADYTNSPEVGGYLDPNHYQDYADVLADYVLGFESHMGVPLTALSLQNEPNYAVDYESADWSAEQFHAFLAVLKAEFTKKGVFSSLPALKIMAPEDANFKEDLILPSLADESTAALIGIVGVHQYEFGPWNVSSYEPTPLTQSLAQGKKIWMTEWNTSAFTNVDDMGRALLLARLMLMDFTAAGMNAYVHWWYRDLVDDEGTPNKNLWAIGQFSRFVRPGWHRVTAPEAAGTLPLAVFKDPDDTQLVAIALNESDADSTFALVFAAGTFGDAQVYCTNATDSLELVGTALSSGTFINVTVPAKSVCTFVSQAVP